MNSEAWLAFFVGGWGSFFTAYVLGQILALLLLRGRIRKWAFLPVPLMLIVIAITVQAYASRSNLWPIWLILISALALLYLATLCGISALRKQSQV